MNCDEYVLGMDIGGTHFRMGIVNQSLHASDVVVYESADIYSSGDTVANFAECIQKYLTEYAGNRKVIAAAIGCPSVVDARRRTLYSSTNFPGLDGVDLVGEMQKYLKIPVFLDHDAYYLLAYDIAREGITDAGTAIGCYFGTGLGNAIYINGKPYIGKNGTASELGHLAIPMNDYPCSCGNKGCIEMFSCGKALEKLNKELYPDTFIGDMFEKHGNEKPLKDFIEYMSVAVAGEINILDPHYIFLGGGIIQMKAFPKEYLVERIVAHTRKPYPAVNLDIRFSVAGAENGIVGAAIRTFEEMTEK